MIRAAACGIAVLIAAAPSGALAQESDSVRVAPPSRSAETTSLVLGRVIPAAAPLLSLEPLVAEAPYRFLYDLGSTGFPHGVGAYGLRPEQQSLTLDGIPFDDLFTGRPRFDLLPLEVLGALGETPSFGYTAGTAATLRPLPAPVARTELRYVTGQEGTQQIGATHAQERRPGIVGEQGRLGILAHVSGRDANGYYGSSDTGGFRALGRLRLLRPTYSVEIVELHQRQTSEARSGVNSFAPSVQVLGVGTSRETVRNDLWTTVRQENALGGSLSGTAFWTVQRSSYRTADTTFVHRSGRGTRIGARLTYRRSLAGHRLEASVSSWRDGSIEGSAVRNVDAATFNALRLLDQTRIGPLAARVEAAAIQERGEWMPTGSVSLDWEEIGLSSTARIGRSAPSRLERGGGFGVAADHREVGHVLSVEASLDRALGPFDARIGGYWLRQEDVSVPAFDPDGLGAVNSVAVLYDGAAFVRLGAEAALGWRMQSPRGPYLALTAAAQSGTAETALGERLLRTLPDYWAHGTLGWRATGVFGGVLDLDAAVGGRYWPAFQSLDFHAPSALYALPASGTPLVPSSATLDASLSARIQRRASVFVLYQNALGTRAVEGSYLVPVFPLTPHQLSFGVFWTLLN